MINKYLYLVEAWPQVRYHESDDFRLNLTKTKQTCHLTLTTAGMTLYPSQAQRWKIDRRQMIILPSADCTKFKLAFNLLEGASWLIKDSDNTKLRTWIWLWCYYSQDHLWQYTFSHAPQTERINIIGHMAKYVQLKAIWIGWDTL